MAALYRRNKQIFSSLIKEEEKKEDIPDIEDLYEKLQKTKNDKRLSLLNNFLESNAKFDDEEYTLLSDIRKKFKDYCYNLDKNNLNNMSYNLSKEDIINYNDRFKIKYYSFCKSCNQRYRHGCCDENNRLNRSSKEVVLYMKLRNN
jgi:hypothetical protein